MTERRLNHDPERIRRRRIAAGLSGQALARKANISKGHLWQIERGTTVASPEMLGQIARALECEISDLMPPEGDAVPDHDVARSA